MGNINLHGKSAPVKVKAPTGSLGNIASHGKVAAIKTRITAKFVPIKTGNTKPATPPMGGKKAC